MQSLSLSLSHAHTHIHTHTHTHTQDNILTIAHVDIRFIHRKRFPQHCIVQLLHCHRLCPSTSHTGQRKDTPQIQYGLIRKQIHGHRHRRRQTDTDADTLTQSEKQTQKQTSSRDTKLFLNHAAAITRPRSTNVPMEPNTRVNPIPLYYSAASGCCCDTHRTWDWAD
jgi:hypothetical protein